MSLPLTSSAYVRLFTSPSRAYAMGMPAERSRWTAEMVRALPDDGKRYEVLDGELFVSPSPSRLHQRAVRELLLLLDPYVSSNELGEVMVSPADVEFSDDRVVQPDVFVIPDTGASWHDMKAPVLIVEILSSSTARADRINKRRIYQDERIPQYWIVDIEGSVVERWVPDETRPEILSDAITWQPRPDLAPLNIDLPKFFRTVMTGVRQDT